MILRVLDRTRIPVGAPTAVRVGAYYKYMFVLHVLLSLAPICTLSCRVFNLEEWWQGHMGLL